MKFEIGNQAIGSGAPLFVVAELGLNHGGSLEPALDLVDAAAEADASAVKVQSFHAASLVTVDAPSPRHVRARSLREFFQRFEFDERAHRALVNRAHGRGLAFVATPFDEPAVEMLEGVGCDAFKIASGDVTHSRLIARAARTGKPLVISTGMSDLDDVAGALRVARDAGAEHLALLHCVSAYPVPPGHDNLRAIAELRRVFGVTVGLSDHGTAPWIVVAAVALGAAIYEKHLMLDGTHGTDAAVSATPRELAAIAYRGRAAQRALGDGRKVCVPAEAANIVSSRRGVYAARDLRAGEQVTPEALAILRPARGLDPRDAGAIIGCVVTRDIRAGEPFTERDLAMRPIPTRWRDVA